MAERLNIQFPIIQFDNSATNLGAASQVPGKGKAAWSPWDLKPFGYDDLPPELEIIAFKSFRQAPFQIPAGLDGDCTFAVDVQGRYCDITNFPVNEDGPYDVTKKLHEMYFKPLGGHLYYPGATRWPVAEVFDPDPIMLRKGDKIIAASQCCPYTASPVTIAIVAGITIRRADGGDFPLIPDLVWLRPVNVKYNDGATPVNRRSMIPGVKLTGSTWQVHVSALDEPVSLLKTSIGIQSGSGPDMVAAPVPVTWNGAAAPTIAAGGEMWSDPFALNVSAGQNLMLNFWSTGQALYKNISRGAPSWGSSTDSHGSAAMLGSVSGPAQNAALATRTFFVDAIRRVVT